MNSAQAFAYMNTPLKSIPKRILYCVHRYAPHPGGSENYVRDMAEETLRQGHYAAVFTGPDHKGDLNGIRVTSNEAILTEPWDLIVVHGGDVGLQNFVLKNADNPALGGPVLYLLILPSGSPSCVDALAKAQYIGCSTLADWRHVESHAVRSKAVKVRHGINQETSVGVSGFRQKHNIRTKYMFLSSGGFWPNKAFGDLVEVFNFIHRNDVTLVLTGYDNRHGLMPADTEHVRSFLLDDRIEMLSALKDADLYILNSTSEGFGLVLLESMLNLTPWVARRIAGAETMQDYGHTYTDRQGLEEYLRTFNGGVPADAITAQYYVQASHLIQHTVEDILKVLA